VLQVMRKDVTWIGVVASVRRPFRGRDQADSHGQGQTARADHAPAAVRRRAARFRRLRQREAVKVMFSLMA
jgi:hypothetical protein